MGKAQPSPPRIRIGPEDRRRLAELAGLGAESAKVDLDRLDTILNEHPFITRLFEHPKPNEVRDLIAPRKSAGLKKTAQALSEKLNAVPWQVAMDY